jgi:FKBP-type peptidyl-prolyl cis-trans isomerase
MICAGAYRQMLCKGKVNCMTRRIMFAMMLLILVSGCNLGGGSSGVGSNCGAGDGKTVTTASEVKYENLQVCGGNTVQSGQTVVVNYKSYIKDGTNLKPLKDTYNAQKPVTFKIGAGQVIKGLEDGVVGMHVGDKRKLTLLPNLAYGPGGNSSEGVPQNTTLIYDVELLEIRQ